MAILGFIFGACSLAFAASCYARIDKLEKRLKELGVLEQDFKSDDET